MGLKPSDVDRMSLWEWGSTLWHWNQHVEESSDDPHAGVSAPSAAEYQEGLAYLRSLNDPQIRV